MSTWLPVPHFPGYEASDDGRVRSLRRGRPRLLSVHVDRYGYHRVNVQHDGANRVVGVHRLVCSAFHGAPPSDLPEARHLNGNPADNAPGNLRWGTHADNMRDRLAHGTDRNASKTSCPRDHPYDEENTRRRRGQRECRTCTRERERNRPPRDRSRRRAART